MGYFAYVLSLKDVISFLFCHILVPVQILSKVLLQPNKYSNDNDLLFRILLLQYLRITASVKKSSLWQRNILLLLQLSR